MPESRDMQGGPKPIERSTRRVLLGWVAGVLIALVVALGLLRIFIRPINPEQEPPTFHFGDPCWVCHLVTEDAELVETE